MTGFCPWDIIAVSSSPNLKSFLFTLLSLLQHVYELPFILLRWFFLKLHPITPSFKLSFKLRLCISDPKLTGCIDARKMYYWRDLKNTAFNHDVTFEELIVEIDWQVWLQVQRHRWKKKMQNRFSTFCKVNSWNRSANFARKFWRNQMNRFEFFLSRLFHLVEGWKTSPYRRRRASSAQYGIALRLRIARVWFLRAGVVCRSCVRRR